MPSRVAVRFGTAEPLFDIRSFGRRAPDRRVLLPAEIEQIARTVARTPEVMVKVSGGAKSIKGVVAHLRYIDRHGKLEIETDEGLTLKGREIEHELASYWDLKASEAERRGPYHGKSGRVPTKLVHNVILSMPKGTPPEKLLSASRAFAREQFALKHRYALVLHTDQDHPHVHLVIKAASEQGKRLNIRKATLREWRSQFARHLRAHGIAANATERAARGRSQSSLKDGIYRAALRGESRYLRERVARVAHELRTGGLKPTPGKVKLAQTRDAVRAGWQAAADALVVAGQSALAEKIWSFLGQMRPPLSTEEQLALKLVVPARARELDKQRERVR